MIRFNEKFVPHLRGALSERAEPAPEGLAKIARSGFLEQDGCFLIKGLIPKRTNVIRSDFDSVGYECFVNHVHLDDYVDVPKIGHAFSFIRDVIFEWRTYSECNLISIVSADDGFFSCRFHMERENSAWISQNLDGYIDAVFVISSFDVKFFDIFCPIILF